MTIEYADEKLMEAAHILATGSGRIQERLLDAAHVLIRLRPDDFPDGELRRTFNGVMDDLTFEQPEGEEGRISATLSATDDEDARAIAKRIVRLYHAVNRLLSER
jgi:hypothetical protein